jgi:hypothetical protein
MSRLLFKLKQDMMNRTLYALTLVTFLSTPVALLTGTFGMNFDDMHELVCCPSRQPTLAPQLPPYSFQVRWTDTFYIRPFPPSPLSPAFASPLSSLLAPFLFLPTLLHPPHSIVLPNFVHKVYLRTARRLHFN